jgi:hypothetical protein
MGLWEVKENVVLARRQHPSTSPIPQADLTFDESVGLTPEQRKTFMEDGFIIIRGAVPEPLAMAALAEINRTLVDPGRTKIYDGYMTDSDTITALLVKTPLWTIAQRLMGRGCIRRGSGAQVELIEGDLGAAGYENNEQIPPRTWHVDGLKPSSHWSPFSLLVGVALSDQSLPNCGNLISFKGSHHVMQSMVCEEFRKKGSHPFLSEEGADNEDLRPPLTNGEQILLGVGDAILQHHKVANRIGVNCTPNIRYQAYFRLIHVDREAHCADGSVHDLWRQYDGLDSDASMGESRSDHDCYSRTAVGESFGPDESRSDHDYYSRPARQRYRLRPGLGLRMASLSLR